MSVKIFEEPQLFNVNEAARYLNVKVSTLYTWVSQSRIPYVKVGRLTKFDPRDLDRWLGQKKVEEQEIAFNGQDIRSRIQPL